MAVTTNYGWPKPALTDAPNGPSQIGALADAVDATVFGLLPQPRLQVHQASSQALTSGSDVVVGTASQPWSTDYDTIGGFSLTTGTWTCPTAGNYKVSAAVAVNAGAVTFCNANFRVGGTGFYGSRFPPVAGLVPVVLTPVERAFAVSDQLTLTIFPNGTGASTAGSGFGVYLRIERVS